MLILRVTIKMVITENTFRDALKNNVGKAAQYLKQGKESINIS